MAYKIKVFLTLQGEGGQAGRCLNVGRFAGCICGSERKTDRNSIVLW